MIMATAEEKKAREELNCALNKLADLDYVGFLALEKRGEKDFYYDDNVESYKEMSKFIAVTLVQCAEDFGTTPEEFLKEVEKKFRFELRE